ncbi:hypothetical protein GCM10027262_05300 [Nocardia tengchongensis]
MPGGDMRVARQRLHIQRLRVLPIDAVPDPPQPRQIPQALFLAGFARHPPMVARCADAVVTTCPGDWGLPFRRFVR